MSEQEDKVYETMDAQEEQPKQPQEEIEDNGNEQEEQKEQEQEQASDEEKVEFEKYELNIEGIEEESLKDFEAFVNEYQIPKEAAEEFVKGYVEKSQKALEDSITNTLKEWEEQVRNDKEIGGDKLEENLSIAKKAAKEIGGDSLIAALEETGVGSHPEIVRVFVRIGKLLEEDKVLSTGGVKSESKDPLIELYPTMASKN